MCHWTTDAILHQEQYARQLGWRRWCSFENPEDCETGEELLGFFLAAAVNDSTGTRPRVPEGREVFAYDYLDQPDGLAPDSWAREYLDLARSLLLAWRVSCDLRGEVA